MNDLQKADSQLPRFTRDDDKKRRYLSFRLCGFGRDEARHQIGLARHSIYHWISTDPKFREIEQSLLKDLRKDFTRESLRLDFIRNMKLGLEKDEQVFVKALHSPDTMTKEEHTYLNKIRPLYTPQQLQILEGFFGEAKDSSFEELILIARKYHVNTNEEISRLEEYPQGADQQNWQTRELTAPHDDKETIEV